MINTNIAGEVKIMNFSTILCYIRSIYSRHIHHHIYLLFQVLLDKKKYSRGEKNYELDID